jgi:hypothetical protein
MSVFCGQKDSPQNVFIKKCFLFMVGSLLSRKAGHNWVEKFSQGCSKVADVGRPGHLVEIATEATVQSVEVLIQADRRITIDSVATALGCSCGLAYNITCGHSKFQKVCTWWVPRELKDQKKMNQMGLSLQLLLRDADE